MSIKITIPNTSSDVLTFGSANTPTAAQISGIDSGSSNGQLALYTTASGTSTEAVRITAAQNVGIGTSSPNKTSISRALTVNGSANAGLELAAADTCYGLLFANSSRFSLDTNNSGANIINFYTSGAERMRIDSSGRLLVGTTGDISAGGYFGVGQFRGSYPALVLSGTEGSGKQWQIGENAGALTFYETVGGERARIDSSGNLLVGNTTALDNSGVGVKIFPSYSGSGAPEVACVSSTSSTSYGTWYMYSTADSQYKFYVNYAGTVFARSTSITGLSDISEKENIRPLETGLSEVMQLQPRRFDWKTGGGSNVAGFVAQEVEAVFPDLVEQYRSSDETTKLGLKMGDMIPTLVKAIQEQQALITKLQADVAALKAQP